MDAMPEAVGRDLVSCEVCLKEIPRAEACSAETRDRVAYFCGPECQEQWAAEIENEAGEP